MEEEEMTSCHIRKIPAGGVNAVLEWVRSRCGPEATPEDPAGSWCWSWIQPGDMLVTLPSAELAFEMQLVRPWLP